MYSARRTDSLNAERSPENFSALGPANTLLAATRSSLREDRPRANTDSVIRVSGTPRSSALWPVHLPVPFCAARSRITSTSILSLLSSFFVNIFEVISIRKLSSSPSFHSLYTSASSWLSRRRALRPAPSQRSR